MSKKSQDNKKTHGNATADVPEIWILSDDEDDVYNESVLEVPNSRESYAQTENVGDANIPHSWLCAGQDMNIDLSSVLPGDDHLSHVEMLNLIKSLEVAIYHQKEEAACNLVKRLCNLKTMCCISYKSDRPTLRQSTEDILLTLHVEDRKIHVGPLELRVNPNLTIMQLKMKMAEEFSIPVNLQRWTVGQQVLEDENATLAQLGLTTDGYVMGLSVQPENGTRATNGITGILDRVVPFTLSSANELVKRSLSANSLDETEAKRKRTQSPVPVKRVVSEPVIGWICPECTYTNIPTRPGCEFCTEPRPEAYVVPDSYVPPPSEQERMKNEKEQYDIMKFIEQEEERLEMEKYQHLMHLDDEDLSVNEEAFECPICFVEYAPKEGVILKECLHSFCRECLINTIKHCETPLVDCPWVQGDNRCNYNLQEREIRALVPPDLFDKYQQRGITEAEAAIANSFHCKTADCRGWCIYEDEVNQFNCPLCNRKNCLTCQAIHEGMNCQAYQEKLELESETDETTKKTLAYLMNMLKKNEAMRCPKCRVILMKKSGCDWLCCRVCKTEICWATRGPRWGPGGRGDTSGGCRCRIDNLTMCHKDCKFCH